MTDFIEQENIRMELLDIDNLPDSLIYKLPEAEFTYSPERFGIGEYLNIEYYERRFERAFPGLLQQFPMMYYMVEEWHANATKRTPLEEILAKQQ
jgi:hypothetical protein